MNGVTANVQGITLREAQAPHAQTALCSLAQQPWHRLLLLVGSGKGRNWR